MGLVNAAAFLTVLCTAALFAAAWVVDRDGGDLRTKLREFLDRIALAPSDRRVMAATARLAAEAQDHLERVELERLSRRVRQSSQLVHVARRESLVASWLQMEIDHTLVALRLYRPLDPPQAQPLDWPLARLTSFSFIEGRGWQAIFDAPYGTQRYLGWQARIIRPVPVA
jgi:hypothetical protein